MVAVSSREEIQMVAGGADDVASSIYENSPAFQRWENGGVKS
jgi:hypothetical protein